MIITRLLVLTLLAPSVALAQEDHAGSASFRIPPGWRRSDTPGGTTLVAGGVQPGTVVIFLGDRALSTSFRMGFDTDLLALNQGLRVVSTTPVQTGRNNDGVELLSTRVELVALNGSRSYRFYLAANPPGRLEMTVYMAASSQLYTAHWNEMLAFVAGLHFTSQTATGPAGPPAAPAAPGAQSGQQSRSPPSPIEPVVVPAGRLEGIYSGYKYIYVTVLGVVQKQATFDQYTFFADGTVYWGLVPMLGFDMARARQKDPEYCGSYSVSGNKISVTMGGGNRFVAVLSGRIMQIEDRPYTLLGDPAKTPSRVLDGIFMREDAQPGEDLARRSIRFTRDGQFEDQGIVESVLPSEIVNGNPIPERPGGRGSYQLARNTLVLRYSDGYEKRIPITIDFADQEKPALSKISVNTYSLVVKR